MPSAATSLIHDLAESPALPIRVAVPALYAVAAMAAAHSSCIQRRRHSRYTTHVSFDPVPDVFLLFYPATSSCFVNFTRRGFSVSGVCATAIRNPLTGFQVYPARRRFRAFKSAAAGNRRGNNACPKARNSRPIRGRLYRISARRGCRWRARSPQVGRTTRDKFAEEVGVEIGHFGGFDILYG